MRLLNKKFHKLDFVIIVMLVVGVDYWVGCFIEGRFVLPRGTEIYSEDNPIAYWLMMCLYLIGKLIGVYGLFFIDFNDSSSEREN